jgi:hypothetical protein
LHKRVWLPSAFVGNSSLSFLIFLGEKYEISIESISSSNGIGSSCTSASGN